MRDHIGTRLFGSRTCQRVGTEPLWKYGAEAQIPTSGGAMYPDFGGIDVTISDHRNADTLGAFVDDFPVGLSAIGLGSRATMNCHGLNSAIFENVANLGSIDGIVVPADADFSGDGKSLLQVDERGLKVLLSQDWEPILND